MTQHLLIVTIASPPVPVAASSWVSTANSRPGPKGGRNPAEGKALTFDGALPYPERSRRNTLLLRRARDAAMPSQNHPPILPALRRQLPHGDAFPPVTGL